MIIRCVFQGTVHMGTCFGEWAKCEAVCGMCHAKEETKN
jgi:hypothetical protein